MPISMMKEYALELNIVLKVPLLLNVKYVTKAIIYPSMVTAVQKSQIAIMEIKTLVYVLNVKDFITSISKMANVDLIMKIMTLNIAQKLMGNAINVLKGLI